MVHFIVGLLLRSGIALPLRSIKVLWDDMEGGGIDVEHGTLMVHCHLLSLFQRSCDPPLIELWEWGDYSCDNCEVRSRDSMSQSRLFS